MQNNLIEKINEAKKYIESKLPMKPEIALILGSGLGEMAEQIEESTVIEYKDIPNFPVSTVQGHKGRLVVGRMNGKAVAAMQGRFHFYEGYRMQEVVFPIWVFKALGVKSLIVTNAAGGINTSFKPGDLMVIKDHINFTNMNPLIGPNLDDFGSRFPDMSEVYSRELIGKLEKSAEFLGLKLREGTYIFLTGPSYETPAEIRAFRTIGADAVGMSTVPEVVAAGHCGMSAVGISCITNMAAGVLNQPLNHQEVMDTADKVKADFSKLIKKLVENM